MTDSGVTICEGDAVEMLAGTNFLTPASIHDTMSLRQINRTGKQRVVFVLNR